MASAINKQSSVSYTLGPAEDNLLLTGTLAINGTGNALPNRIVGNKAANVIDGAGGADILDGAGGNDIYMVSNPSIGPNVIEITDTGTSGVDEVRITSMTSGKLIFSGNERGIERVVIGTGAAVKAISTGAASVSVDALLIKNKLTIVGNAGNNYIRGTAFADSIEGGAGSDDLETGGGIDAMAGGAGDDRYYLGDSKVIVKENPNEGVDTVYSTAPAYTLPNNVEQLILLYFGANNQPLTTNISAIGNALNNYIVGNAVANIIDGAAGADTMIGQGGNDTYIVDSSLDVVIEALGAGVADLVQSTATNFTLPSHVENLTLMGKANINGTGNGAANLITGNSGSNTLTGGGGNDTMTGGAGADRFVLNGVGTTTITDFGNGADILINGANSSVSMTLTKAWVGTNATRNDGLASILSDGLKVDLSKVTLGNGFSISNIKDGKVGSKAANFIGSGLDDVITGGAGADTLNGGAGNDIIIGGGGNDLITGGAGNDLFRFTSPPDAKKNVDTIFDFAQGQDKINFDARVFAGFLTLNESFDFLEAATGLNAATLASTRVIYNKTSGALYYDQDGSATEFNPIQVAIIGKTTHPALDSSDFIF